MSIRNRLALVAMMVAALGACATHRVAIDDGRAAATAALARADQRLLDGCYACLIEARDAYTRLTSGPIADLASIRLFGAEALIVLREKELAIETSGAEARLEAAPTLLPADVDARRLLGIVDLIPPNAIGLPDTEHSAFVRARMASAGPGQLDGELDWLAASSLWEPVREYVTLSLQCSAVGRPLLTPMRRWRETEPRPDAPPLIAYRRALCAGNSGLPALEALREATPTFAEAAYELARNAPLAQQRASSTEARTLASEAFNYFPQSPAVNYVMATIAHASGDCGEALRFYDATLALRARHENAQLGRTACLTHLDRPEDAIAAATTLIEWQSTNLRDGFYWRAYNLHVLRRFDQARQDVERSKQLGSTIENHTLAGMIEYEQDDLDPALLDLERAWSLGRGRNCTAAWYQGLVHVKRESWSDAAPGFERAVGCYRQDVADVRVELAAMEARTDLDPEVQRTEMQNLTQALQIAQRRRWDSAINGANCFVRSGDVTKAAPLLVIASEDPTLAEDVASLKAVIEQRLAGSKDPAS